MYEHALIAIRDECFSGNAYDIAVEALAFRAVRSNDILSAAYRLLVASDQFVRDTGMKHSDAITEAAEGLRAALTTTGAGRSSDQRGVSATQATGTAACPTTTAGLQDRMGESQGAPGNSPAPNANSGDLLAAAIFMLYVSGRMVDNAKPDDTEAQNAVVAASLWREFVDAHAAMLYASKLRSTFDRRPA